VLGASASELLSASPQRQAPQMPMPQGTLSAAPAGPPADFNLRIAPVLVELAPRRALSTIGYNGTSPGPVLRMREGKLTTVDVINDTDVPELVHWHGQLVPSAVDGSEEEGTPLVPPRGRRRYQFRPGPTGTRWYHSHAMSGTDLHRGTYTGQFGFVLVEGANNPGRYDQELFLAFREWEPFFSDQDNDDETAKPGVPEHEGPRPAPVWPAGLESPAMPDTRPNGWEIGYRIFSINDKLLGGGEPIRVKPGQRVLMHLLNASATSNRRVAFPAHKFQVVALDGNPVPVQRVVDVLEFGPGERIDAIVEMNQPGVWILGTTRDSDRENGMGILVEYPDPKGHVPWFPPPMTPWDYTMFGKPAAPKAPDQTIEMIIEGDKGGPGGFNQWKINGKQNPEIAINQGVRYRLLFRNRSDDSHPVHLHRHRFELAEFNGKPTSGIMKDTVVVPAYGRVAVDFVADQPGLTLFHCHNQLHMDFGFKALFRYS
jgi:FtsP/CotA-like multicopper oxidase with cupredoxin domain